MKKTFLFFSLLGIYCSTVYPWSHSTSSPVIICDKEETQDQVQLIKTTDGNFIILWVDERRGIVPGLSWKFKDVYGQKINSSGEIMWDEDGIPIVQGYGEGVEFEKQCDVKATADSGSGVILSWTDASGGGIQGNNVRINRIDGNGNKLWGSGVLLQPGDSGANESICSDGQGGAFAVWSYGGFRLWYPRGKVSHLDQNGNVVSNLGSISSKGGNDGEGSAIASPVIKTSSSGSAIAGWEDDRDGPYYGWRSLRVQKFADAVLWTTGGVRVSLPNNNINNIVGYCGIVNDDSGGLIAFWADNRNGNKDIFAQRVNSSGETAWQEGGIAICNVTGEQSSLQAVSDNSGGAIVVWTDSRSGINQIYAQHISKDGNRLWQENGVLIGTGTSPGITNLSDGNYLVFWKSSDKLYAQKIGNDGVGWWQDEGVQVSNTNFSECKAVTDIDGTVFVWTNGNIYAQKLFNNGTVDPDSPLTITTGKDLLPGALEKTYNVRICATGGNGNRYTWQITKGNLPQGLSFDQTTGIISGTPAQLGIFNFVVSATDDTSIETKQFRLFIQIDTGMEIFSDSDWPAVARGSSYLLVTRQSVSTSSYIYCQFLDDSGYKVGYKFIVYENDWVDMLDVAYNPVNDKYLIVFNGGDYIPNNPDYHLYGIFVDGQTHQVQQPFVISNQPYRLPAIGVNTTNGDYVIVASEHLYGGKWIGIMLDKDGQLKTQFDIGQKNQWPGSCSIAYNSSENNFLVTYTYSSMKYVWGRIIGSDGSVNTEITVATSPSNDALSCNKVIYNPATNKFLLGYTLYYPGRVFARYIDSNGEPSGDSFYISRTTLQEQQANVAVSLSGKTCAFWSDRADEKGNYDSNSEYIYAQKITEAGPGYENDELITPYSGLKRTPVAVAGNTDNNFLLLWKRWEGSFYKVYGVFYNLPRATGDINNDETIDISDVILCLRQAIGLDPVNKNLADMNEDGNIDISDVILILRKAIGMD